MKTQNTNIITTLIIAATLQSSVAANAKPLGAIAGGVVGAAIGNQIGGGNGKVIATAAGAAAGAVIGNEITNPKPAPRTPPQAPMPTAGASCTAIIYQEYYDVGRSVWREWNPSSRTLNFQAASTKDGCIKSLAEKTRLKDEISQGYVQARTSITAMSCTDHFNQTTIIDVKTIENGTCLPPGESQPVAPTVVQQPVYVQQPAPAPVVVQSVYVQSSVQTPAQAPLPPPPPGFDSATNQDQFMSTTSTSYFTRKSGGNWVQVLFSQGSSISDVLLKASGAGILIHEVQLVDQQNEMIQINDFSSVRIQDGISSLVSDLSGNGVVTAINIRAESMGGDAYLKVKIHSQNQTSLRLR